MAWSNNTNLGPADVGTIRLENDSFAWDVGLVGWLAGVCLKMGVARVKMAAGIIHVRSGIEDFKDDCHPRRAN